MAFTFNKKQVLLYGGFFFLAQCILAVIFCRERLYVDSAYYFYHTVESGWFKIDHQQFILALAEILPLIGSYIGLPLKTLMILYSLDHVFFFIVLFLILVKRNDLNGALAITALLTFNALNLFVNPMLEIWYGAGLAIAFFSFLQSIPEPVKAKVKQAKKGKVKPSKNSTFNFQLSTFWWLVLLEITILMSHPENSILVFLFVLLDIQKRKAFNRVHFMMSIIFIAVAIYKHYTLDAYETSKLGGDFHIAHIFHCMNLFFGAYAKSIWALLFQYYWVLLLLMAVSCTIYGVKGRYLRGALILSAFVGTIALVNAADKTNTTYSFYGSIMYMPIVSIAVVPFFYDIFGTMKEKIKIIAFALFVLLIGLRLYNQADAMGDYTQRVNQMERVIRACDKAGGNKFIVNTNNFEKPYSKVNWSFALETLLLSAERGKDSCRSIATQNDAYYVKTIFTDSSAVMLTAWDIVQDNELNQKYFHSEKGIYKTVEFKE